MDRMSLPPNNSEDSVMTTRRTEKAKTEKKEGKADMQERMAMHTVGRCTDPFYSILGESNHAFRKP